MRDVDFEDISDDVIDRTVWKAFMAESFAPERRRDSPVVRREEHISDIQLHDTQHLNFVFLDLAQPLHGE